MSKHWLVGLLAGLLCVGLAAAETEKKEKKEEKKEKKEEKKQVVLPDAAAKTVQARCKNGTIESAKEKKENDKVFGYEVKVTCKSGHSCKMVIAPDGKLLEAGKCKIAEDALPAAVADTVKKWAPGAKVGKVEVETKKDTGTVYEIEAELNGKNIKAKIAEDGKVVKADKLPEAKPAKKEEKK